MTIQQILSISVPLFPIALGIVGVVVKIPFSMLRPVGLMTIVGLGVFLGFAMEIDPTTQILAFAVLLSGFCVFLCQEESPSALENCLTGLTIMGLTLGALLDQGLVSRLFLCGLLGYTMFSLTRKKSRSFRTTLILIHFIIAILLSLSSNLGGETLQRLASLFLAITFLPLFPFHLPFVGTIEAAKGNLASFSIVIWLAIGLAELNQIFSSLSTEIILGISLLSLVSAFYSSLAALGLKHAKLFVAAATMAHISLLWGLLNVLPNFSKWGIPFGIAVAFVLGGICLAFSFVHQRYGWQTIGKLPGLASPMPRFGRMMVLLVSFSLFLPMFPFFAGLTMMPTIETFDAKFIVVFIMFIAVWLGGGWYFIQMLHQTAFGAERRDVPYTDLRTTEITAVTVLLFGACYSGLLY